MLPRSRWDVVVVGIVVAVPLLFAVGILAAILQALTQQMHAR